MARVIRWDAEHAPSQAELRRMMEAEHLRPYTWSNGPGERYAVHRHSYEKVIYVVEGSIRFGLPEENRTIDLAAGDRLDLPADVAHDAEVGPQGVTCLEAQR